MSFASGADPFPHTHTFFWYNTCWRFTLGCERPPLHPCTEAIQIIISLVIHSATSWRRIQWIFEFLFSRGRLRKAFIIITIWVLKNNHFKHIKEKKYFIAYKKGHKISYKPMCCTQLQPTAFNIHFPVGSLPLQPLLYATTCVPYMHCIHFWNIQVNVFQIFLYYCCEFWQRLRRLDDAKATITLIREDREFVTESFSFSCGDRDWDWNWKIL